MFAVNVPVTAGTTYSAVAERYGVSVSAVEEANPYSATDLPLGATLHVPDGSGGEQPQASSPTSLAPVSAAPGSFQSCVIQRESNGDSQVLNSSGHYGLYQFDYSTWVAGGGNPSDFGRASVAEQNQVFSATYAARGSEPWAGDGC